MGTEVLHVDTDAVQSASSQAETVEVLEEIDETGYVAL